MSEPILVTGATGYLGRMVVELLSATTHYSINALVRRPSESTFHDDIRVVHGDLADPESYRAGLAEVDTVLHLAAQTGKASAAEYKAINADATRKLVDVCREAGVKRILLVSTIAAGFTDQRFYHYAKSKVIAEEAVRNSALAYTILRPTVILGPGAPNLATLSKIADLPVIPLPQGSRTAHVQPVHVRDVASAISMIVEANRFEGETLDIGGPEQLAFADFLQKLRNPKKSGTKAKVLKVPLKPIQLLLAALEPIALKALPATAGQLSIFGNDAIARPNWLMEALRDDLVSLEDTLSEIKAAKVSDGPGQSGGQTATPDLQAGKVLPRDHLSADFVQFGQYLTGQVPAELAIEHYASASAAHELDRDGSGFDHLAIALARGSQFRLRLVDSYCGVFCRSSILRRRLVLAAAVLECGPQTHSTFEFSDNHGKFRAFVRLAFTGLCFATALVLSTLVLTPLRLIYGYRWRSSSSRNGGA